MRKTTTAQQQTRSVWAPPGSSASSSPRPGFRRDIEGLRAVAVLLVLLSHAGVPLLGGGFIGVDVFFVISGFLITSRIRDEIGTTGRFSLARFYAARVERLLPAAIVTLYAVLLLMFLVLPRIRWRETAFDIAASGAYVVNWRLAERATDYFAATAPSAVQHYWSLAVEEQYYLIWPLLFLLVLAVARKRQWRMRRIWQPLLIGLGIVSAASFAWSVIQTVVSPLTAYFDTTTRLWELGIGSALAIAVMKRRFIRRTWREPMAAAGLLSIAVSAVAFDGSTGFPGYAALLPTAGTALLLFAGETTTQQPRTLSWLNAAPMQHIGALSYSLYLWHWPLLVLAAAEFGPLTAGWALAVVAFSFVPAYVSYRFVEQPIRKRRWLRDSPWNALVVAVAGAMVTIVAATAVAMSAAPAVPRPQPSSLDQITYGAAVLAANPLNDPSGAPVDHVPEIVPDPAAAPKDGPDVDRGGCFATPADSAVRTCEYGDKKASYKVMLVGDSHAAQWQPALRAVAEAKGWHLIVLGKSACPLAETTVLSNHKRGQGYTECAEWNASAQRLIASIKPSLIVTTSYRFVVFENGKALLSTANQTARIAAMRQTWANLAKTGAQVVVLRDTPLPPFDVADCVSGNLDQLTKCAFDRERAVNGFGDDQIAAAGGLTGVHLLDFSSAICPTATCAPVIGGVLVYRDKDHLTATYALSLAPRVLAALESLPAR